MMKAKYFISPIVITILAAGACKTETRYPKEIAGLDSLYKEIERAEKEYLRADTGGIAAMEVKIGRDIAFVQQNYKDTMDFKTALLVSNYHGILKPITNYREKTKELEEESAYSKKQIMGLMHDLNNNLLPGDSAQAYMGSEKQAGEELLKTFEMMKQGLKYIKERYELFNPGIDSLVNSLKTAPEKAG